MTLSDPGDSVNSQMDWIQEKMTTLQEEMGWDQKTLLIWLLKLGWKEMYGEEQAGSEDRYSATSLNDRQKEFLVAFDRLGGKLTKTYQTLHMSASTPYAWRTHSAEFETEYGKIANKHKWKHQLRRAGGG